MATVTSSIGTSSRDYSTVTLWEAAISTGSADDIVGEMYADSDFDENALINVAGSLLSVKLCAAAGEGHDGSPNSGVRFLKTASGAAVEAATAVDVTLEDAELDYQETYIGKSGGGALHSVDFVHRILLHGLKGYGYQYGIINAKYPRNCVVYDIELLGTNTYHGFTGIQVAGTATGATNCTVHNIRCTGAGQRLRGIAYSQWVTGSVENNIATDIINTGNAADGRCFDSGAGARIVTHNISSDTSSEGTGSVDSVTAASLYVSTTVGSEDLSLKSGELNATNGGTNLGSAAGTATDAAGHNRYTAGGDWDIGAYEFVAAAAGGALLRRPHLNYERVLRTR